MLATDKGEPGQHSVAGLLMRSALSVTVSLLQFADVREVFDGIPWSSLESISGA